MKKKLICLILACFLFCAVPVKGYATTVSPLVFGMAEEVVLPFLASLLGLSAKTAINDYTDLTEYANDLRLGFTEYLAGSATALKVGEWIGQAALGNINRDSVVWQKFYEYCMSLYKASGNASVTSNNILSVPAFDYTLLGNFTWNGRSFSSTSDVMMTGYVTSTNNSKVVMACDNSAYVYRYNANNTTTTYSLTRTYTYSGKTVYYNYFDGYYTEMTIENSVYSGIDYAKIAWLMVYGGYEILSGDAVISGAFDGVLTSSEVNDLFDGTSVLQLYNPAVAQNGLQIVPDPDDPNDIEVPAMLTADWYNFLKQFGPSGAAQFVAAYNALNAVQGVSTGAIDAMYNNLGIASAISSAAQAAQGTLTLSDNNVFPQLSTISDAVNGVIPGALTPQAPDAGIDNESDQGLYKLPDLKDFFPFCIPFDLIDLLSCFIAEPETPQFVIALSTGEDTVTGQMDLHIWDNIASVLRGLELMAFTVGLILITRNIIRG